MSTKSTIFLTSENEHCYYEGADPHYKDEKWIGDTIVLEMREENIRLVDCDEGYLIIEIINPESEIYKKVSKMGGK